MRADGKLTAFVELESMIREIRGYRILHSHTLSASCMSLLTTRALLSAQKYATTEPTERQRIANQIDAAFILARADFVNVHR